MEDKEALHRRALISRLSDAIKCQVDGLLPNHVMAAGVVVCCILFAVHDVLGMEQLMICSCSTFINNSWFEIDEDSPRNMFTCIRLEEEEIERIVTNADGLIRWHLTVGLDATFETVELSTPISDLDTGLSSVSGDNFAHWIVDGRSDG
jgi:hypothetical protein